MDHEKIDIVIPLSSESFSENIELRLALRSIARFAGGVGKVWVLGTAAPRWLTQIEVLPIPDRHRHNKDANIIDKLLTAADQADLSRRFVFWSDDQLALHRFNLSDLRPVFNSRGREDFTSDRVWHRRMRNTFDFLSSRGFKLDWNWDSHVPQIIDKDLFKNLLQDVEYQPEPGFCVNTLFFGLAGTPPRLQQSSIKVTCEDNKVYKKLPAGRLFLGYNDAACRGNLLQLLHEYLPTACCYEQT